MIFCVDACIIRKVRQSNQLTVSHWGSVSDDKGDRPFHVRGYQQQIHKIEYVKLTFHLHPLRRIPIKKIMWLLPRKVR